MELNKIEGITNRYIKLLNTLGIYTAEDLMEYYPYRYQVYNVDNISSVQDKSNVVIEGKINSIPLVRYIRGKLNILTFKMLTNMKEINVTIYNRAFMKKNLTPLKDITVIGKYDEKKNLVVASNILLSKIDNGSIESIYHLTSGLSNNQINKFINNASTLDLKIDDYIPEYLNTKYNFISKKEAIEKIHFPKDISEVKEAKLKLIYEELFKFMFKINYLKFEKTKEEKTSVKVCSRDKLDSFINSLPFSLTKDQISSINDIYKDMTSNKRMNRLLCGDVGSGKTIVAVLASYINFIAGYQTALMVPTEILAKQHFENISKLFKSLNINIEILLGKTKKKDKEKIYEELKSGRINLLIGTHSLLNEKVEFNNLGLVITDEQHRFGVAQRENLRIKGKLPDILYMSATPIPRTYALTIYGDMDISLIKTKPSGRKEVKTIIKSESEIKEVLYMMLEEIKKGHQVYVVSPLIEDNASALSSALELEKKIKMAFSNKIKVGLLHGKLSNDEKENIMNDFKNGDIKVLVSTTVIEVGVDVENATMMVIFNADRFGLATLHQLRGRIGRNDLDCSCILIGNLNQRLKVLEESNDGFYITEKDYEMRKEGDLFGVKQSGDMTFKISDIKRDFKILLKAKEDSNEFIEKNKENYFKNDEKYYKIINEIKSLD